MKTQGGNTGKIVADKEDKIIRVDMPEPESDSNPVEKIFGVNELLPQFSILQISDVSITGKKTFKGKAGMVLGVAENEKSVEFIEGGGGCNVTPIELTYSATVVVDCGTNLNYVLRLTGDCELRLNNIIPGVVYQFLIKQDGIGGHRLTLRRPFYYVNGYAQDTTANGVSKLIIDHIDSKYFASIDRYIPNSADMYEITWKDGNTVLEIDYVLFGEMPVYSGQTPTQQGYIFVGWTPEPVPVDGDAIYTALYSPAVHATFFVDGVLTEDVLVAEGDTPVYSGPEPTKQGYRFDGWNPALGPITQDTAYNAVFTAVYTATFEDYDGTILDTQSVVAGDTPVYGGPTPSRTGYDFIGWTPALGPISGDVTYVATYEIKTFTITWNNYDGTVLDTDTVQYGAMPSYSGQTPTRASTVEYDYTFDTWSPSIVTCTGDATYTATYTQTIRNYTITWKNDDGTILDTDTVQYGATPSYSGQTPTKASTAQYDFTFDAWSPSVVACTGDAIYTATYTQTIRSYTITWKNYDGTVLDTDIVQYGDTPTYGGTQPTRQGYSFTGWSPSIAPVSGNATYTAVFGFIGIFWNPSSGLFSASSDGVNWITLADKNLGATTVFNDGDTLTSSNAGLFYQWGNNYGFSWFNMTSPTSGTQINASSYGPSNPYTSSTFITGNNNWMNPNNSNMWGGDTSITTNHQGPCQSGWHIPTKGEIDTLFSYCNSFGLTSPIPLFKFPRGDSYGRSPCIDLNYNAGLVTQVFAWTCTGNSSQSARDYAMAWHPSNSGWTLYWYKANGLAIRPFKDTPVVPNTSWTVIYQQP